MHSVKLLPLRPSRTTHISWNSKFCCHVKKSPPLCITMSQLGPLNPFTDKLLISLILITSCLLALGFSTNRFYTL